MSRLFFGVAIATLAAACASAAPSDSATRNVQEEQIHSACASLGLNPSEAPFAYCMRSLRASAPAQPATAAVTPASVAYTPNGVLPSRAAERQACSIIGLDPATAQFAACVANLDATLVTVSRVGTD
jgi:hypothetical protein